MEMPLNPTIYDILLRLLLSLIAGALIGFNREARGHTAGLRTILLISLAATIAMIQANILLSTSGKIATSFSDMDVMRIPLGILTGVGFIGGGCILKKESLVMGVTTAATIWIMTIIGLCFGGGQLILGTLGTILCLLTIHVFRWVDGKIAHEQHAFVTIHLASHLIPTPPDLSALIKPLGYRARFSELYCDTEKNRVKFLFEISWKGPLNHLPPTDLISILGKNYGIDSFKLQLKPKK